MTYHSIAVIDTQSVWRKNTRMAEEEDERIEPLSHAFFLSLYVFLLLMLSSMEEKKKRILGLYCFPSVVYTLPRTFRLFLLCLVPRRWKPPVTTAHPGESARVLLHINGENLKFSKVFLFPSCTYRNPSPSFSMMD